MNLDVMAMFNSWMRLTPEDRDQFHSIVGAINDVSDEERNNTLQRISNIVSSIEPDIMLAIDPGPLKKPCPRCGR